MTRKDYILIARALYDAYTDEDADRDSDGAADFDRIVLNISAAFASDNPRFDPKRFSTAVYTGKGVA